MGSTTRRAALRGAASVIATAPAVLMSTPMLALPAIAGEPDPIFAAIANRKRLWAEFGAVLREENDLWDIDDDPRRTAWEDRQWAAGEAAADAAWLLVEVQPVMPDGLAALMLFAADAEDGELPDGWSDELLRSSARALMAMTACEQCAAS
jgi:hypothetical protein